jgi:hypothetical protein
MNHWTRQIHRWLSIIFTLGVIINTYFAATKHTPPPWVYGLALGPLFALLATGLYLFVLPYIRKIWRTSEQA